MKKICKSCIPIIIILIIIIGAVSFKIGFNIGGAKYKKVIDYHFPIPEEMVIADGKIIAIQASILTTEIIIQDAYTIPEEWKSKTVKITITDETKIIKHELEGFKEIEFSELKVEDQISARAEENILDKNEFTAKAIEVHYSPDTE
jgi:hypothetical protein